MNKEIKIVAGVGLAAGTVVGAYYINELNRQKSGFPANAGYERSKNMFDKKTTLVNEEGAKLATEKAISTTKSSLSPIEKEKISSMVNGMSEEEMKITLQNIPMALIFNHIAGVLERNRQFAQSIQDAMNRLQE